MQSRVLLLILVVGYPINYETSLVDYIDKFACIALMALGGVLGFLGLKEKDKKMLYQINDTAFLF